MEPLIQRLNEKKLLGIRMDMSLAENKTPELWGNFMRRRNEIPNAVKSGLYSVNIYPDKYFEQFDPARSFEKWAAVEVENFDVVPIDMETLILEKELYAVFLHKGSSNENSIFQYIYSTWLPSSGYALDDRPHFEVLGEKYKNGSADSEEEIWIPIKR